MTDSQDLLDDAVRRHQAGQLAEAKRLYRQSLATDPCHADALHLLGVIAHQSGQGDLAVTLIGNAIQLQDHLAPYHSNLGSALKARGRLTDAIAAYGAALSLDPNDADGFYNLGTVLHSSGQIDEAVAAFGRALRILPTFAEAHYNLGVAVQALGHIKEAVAAYNAALTINPGYALAQCNRGVARAELGRQKDAFCDYGKAIRLRPSFAVAHSNMGNALHEVGRSRDAVGAYAAALSIKPDYAEAHSNRGNALKAVGRLIEAAAAYRAAIQVKPDLVEAHYNLGIALKALGRSDDAVAAYSAALQLKPDLTEARLALVDATIPILADSIPQSLGTTEKFVAACQALADWNEANPGKLGEAVGSTQPFYLAYRPGSLLAPLSRYGDLVCTAAATYWQKAIPALARPSRDRRRLVIVTGYARRHSVWDIVLRGLIAHLDRQWFEVFIYHTRPVIDEETAWAKTQVDRWVQGPKPIEDWLHDLGQDQPDVIFYPEIGMDPTTCSLAMLRLAPLQIAGWGHPVTTGLPDIDLFLSGELLEGPEADQHYRERLVRLPGTGVCTEPRPIEPQAWLGPARRRDVVRFTLCQQPIKFDPADDALLARIAKEVGPSEFWLASLDKMPWATTRLRERLAGAFRAEGLDADAHLQIMPWLPPGQFVDFLDKMDIYLDCPAFSGYTTAWQAVHRGLPIVTLEGEFLRQRLAAGLLRQIGMTDGIALSRDHYVEIAVRWAAESRDAEQWKTRREAIRSAAPLADGNRDAVRALEQTLIDALAQATSRVV